MPTDSGLDARWAALWPQAVAALTPLYGHRPDFPAWLGEVEARVRAAAAARSRPLRALDAEREARPDWFQQPDMIAYTGYVDRFAGTLKGLAERIPYLRELGVRYLHPLPVSRPRAGDSDGGFAVADYLDVDPKLGSMDDLRDLCGELRAAGISLVLDVVCNHTADDHAWAQAALAGDAAHRDFYHVLETRAEADAYEATLIDVFPNTAPGSFTWREALGGFVWTTFYPYQWDLNYENPAVFAAMLDVLLQLANVGADGFRLDSAPFLWKRRGTTCRGLPEAHLIVQAWRALLSIAAPGVLLKAEAIEQLDDVLPFFGPVHDSAECQLAYNNGAMTALWAALATQDTAPVQAVIAAAAARPPRGAWLNYVRCHDDLIWSAIAPYAPQATLDHLSRFYAGEAANAFAHGEAFQASPGAAPSTNGMTADLVGLHPHAAPDDPAVRRTLMLYAVTYALDGAPLIYMGDEIGLLGDRAYRHDPHRAGDGRWLQRPMMDWPRADRRHKAETVEAALFEGLARLGRLRAAEPAFHARLAARPFEAGDAAVLGLRREGPTGAADLMCLANFAPTPRTARLPTAGEWDDLLSGEIVEGDKAALAPYQARWLKTRR